MPRFARRGNCFVMNPRGLRAPGPCAYFWPAPKVGKNAPEPMVLDSFLGAALWAATSAGEERAVRQGFWIGEASELAVLLQPLWLL